MAEEIEYEFQATGDACEVCQALDGTNVTTRPHPNCLCQIVPAEKECTYELAKHLKLRGPGDYDFTWSGELTVFCPDGSEAGGMSLEFDASGFGPSGDGWIEHADSIIDDAVKELCGNCSPPEEPPNIA